MLSHRVATRSVLALFMIAPLIALTACQSATEPTERVFSLEVAPTRVPCVGVMPQECLQVRERSDASYTLFYDTIAGFTYEPGYRYMLEVGEQSVSNPPADGSSKSFRLIELRSKTSALD